MRETLFPVAFLQINLRPQFLLEPRSFNCMRYFTKFDRVLPFSSSKRKKKVTGTVAVKNGRVATRVALVYLVKSKL